MKKMVDHVRFDVYHLCFQKLLCYQRLYIAEGNDEEPGIYAFFMFTGAS